MPKISGSDGFVNGLPGVCEDCFKTQARDPHPPYYYCEHNRRLAVQRDGFWETFRDIGPDDIDKIVRRSI